MSKVARSRSKEINCLGHGLSETESSPVLNICEVAMAIAPVFKETYESYLSQIGKLHLAELGEILGVEVQGRQATIPLFNRIYRVGPQGIVSDEGKTPHLSVCVILCRYLLMCPHALPHAGGLAAFKDFKDAGPLIHYFDTAIQGEVVRSFSGNLPALAKACSAMGGTPYKGDMAYQLKFHFWGLPRIPVYLFFNDAEEGFAAQCTMLFDHCTEAFLDMESVAMLGSELSHGLKFRSAKSRGSTL